jgi:hypothetical protein
MTAKRTVGVVLLLLTTACSAPAVRHAGEESVGPLMVDTSLLSTSKGGTVAPAPSPVAAMPAPAQGAPEVPLPQIDPPTSAAPQARETETTTGINNAAAIEQPVPAAVATPDARITDLGGTTAEPPRAKTVAPIAKPVAPPVAIAPAVKVQPALPIVAKPVAAPTLDVAGLTQRLRETKAIGVFSKLALKNQMDDVLGQFRAAYRDGHTRAPVALRQPYEMLVLKVLALLQEGDPDLARSVAGSREAIWTILADAETFRTIA